MPAPTPARAHMRLFIAGAAGRDYSTALAPETKDAPEPYGHSPTPVLVIRQQGEAWTRPFAVIYEPFTGSEKAGSIQAVTALTQNQKFAGFKVVSQIAGRTSTQYILVQPSATSAFEDAALGLSFRGRYAVIRIDENGKPTALYLGDGSKLSFQGVTLSSA